MAPSSKQTKDKQKQTTGGGTSPDTTPRPAVQAPVSNSVRAARAMRAANTPAPSQPPPISLRREHIDFGLIPFVGPYLHTWTEKKDLVFELMWHPTLAPDAEIRDAIWPAANLARLVPVKFGDLAAGEIWIFKDARNLLQTAYTDQMIPFVHPALPEMEPGQQFALTINISDGDVTGELVLTTDGSQPRGFVAPLKRITEVELPSILGLEDLQGVRCWIAENLLSYGKYELDVMFDDFRLDGVFPESDSKVSFFQLRNYTTYFEAYADVEAKGVEKKVVPIQRDQLGGLSAHANLKAELTPIAGHKVFGRLDAMFDRGVFSATGTLSYVSDKIQGEIEVVLTDLKTARDIARQYLGELAPPDPKGDDAPNELALTGRGILEFDFNKWLRGRAEVIVDPDGYITTLGHIAPDAQIEVFKRRSVEKSLYHDHDWGVMWVDIVPVPYWWGISLTVHAFVGPAMLGDIVVEGVYSTHPGVSRHFSIAGTLVIPGEVGADLDAYFKGGIPKLANAGGEISASAKVRLHAGVRPRIGWDRPGRSNADDPVSGRYFIDGEIFGGADIILGLRGGVTAQLIGKPLSWKPLHHTWRLGRLRYGAGGKFYFGSPTEPTTWSFDPNPKQKKPDYEKLLDDASVAKLPSGDGKEDPITPEWVDGVTDSEREPEGYTPPEKQLGPAPVETPTLAGGDLPAEEHVDHPPGAAPAVPPAPHGEPPKTQPATEMPPPEPTTPPAEVVEDFRMMDEPHQLFLTRDRTPKILMASMPPRSPLAKRIQDALEVLDTAIATPPPGRTADDLKKEREKLEKIYDATIRAETKARDFGYDVTQGIPEHFPDLYYIAKQLGDYAFEFNRTGLLVYVPFGGPRAIVVSVFDDKEVDRKLAQHKINPPDRKKIIDNLHDVPVGTMVAAHILSDTFDDARYYDEVLKTLKKKAEVADTLVVLDHAAMLIDRGFEIVFEAQKDRELIGPDARDVDIAAIDSDGTVVYAIAVKRPRDISTLATKLNEGADQVQGAQATTASVVAYVSHGTEQELRTKYRQGVIDAQDRYPNVEMRIIFPDGVELTPEDL